VNNLQTTPSADRLHIAFFGVRNAGKSSLVNAVTGQDIAVVSAVKGTTTDPVKKAMELLPLGAVMIIDTPGFDDDDKELGALRLKKARQVLETADVAVLVTAPDTDEDWARALVAEFVSHDIPYITVCNKADLITVRDSDTFYVSAKTGEGVHELKEKIGQSVKTDDAGLKLLGGLVGEGDNVLLIMPQDSAAPKGRLILPEQQMLRDVLDADGVAISVRTPKQAGKVLAKGGVSLVITDSQAFKQAAEVTPDDVPLTSFSILFARYNGILDYAKESVKAIDTLKDGDTVLISEGCTHHRQCDDIGTVKIPALLRKRTGKNLNFEFTSGGGFMTSKELTRYKLCIHCGGCMLRKRTVIYRMNICKAAGVPFTNYGVALAALNGILDRATRNVK
jgi:[FeFe] hydrogenase H-cluster maturation GTPase HydF